ncbi:MAG TPA: HEAT repeat domain-containing protein, partial [Anaerolineales bacterium]|nr:HEAT repeat domain-containing protein [Anaerolineales bacterium]
LQAGQSFAMKTALAFLASAEDKKKSTGAKIAMLVDSEKNVNLILPLLDESNWLIRWQTIHSITRTKRFLEDDELIGWVVKGLLEDSSPEVRVEAAEALGYCKITPKVISALEHARDHDFEFDGDGYRASTIAKEALKRIQERQADS